MTASDNQEDSPHAEEHGEKSHGGIGKYFVVFFMLCGLTSLSFMTYFPFWDKVDQRVSWSLMMGVSCMKAGLVISVFMHLWWETKWKYMLTLPAAGMGVFLVCMLIPDVGRRAHYYNDYRWVFAADPDEAEADENDSDIDDAQHGESD